MSTLPWGPIKKKRELIILQPIFSDNSTPANWTLERISMATMLQLIKKASQSIYNQLYLQINQNLPAGFKDFKFSFLFQYFYRLKESVRALFISTDQWHTTLCEQLCIHPYL